MGAPVSFVSLLSEYSAFLHVLTLENRFLFNLHISSRILRKNQYNNWTKYKEKVIVFQLTQAV